MKTNNNDIILNITHSPTKRKFRRQASVLELDDLIEQMRQFLEDANRIVKDVDELHENIEITCSSCCNNLTFLKSFRNCFKRNKLKN